MVFSHVVPISDLFDWSITLNRKKNATKAIRCFMNMFPFINRCKSQPRSDDKKPNINHKYNPASAVEESKVDVWFRDCVLSLLANDCFPIYVNAIWFWRRQPPRVSVCAAPPFPLARSSADPFPTCTEQRRGGSWNCEICVRHMGHHAMCWFHVMLLSFVTILQDDYKR